MKHVNCPQLATTSLDDCIKCDNRLFTRLQSHGHTQSYEQGACAFNHTRKVSALRAARRTQSSPSSQMTLPRCPTASQSGKKIGLFRCGEDAERRIYTLCTSAQQSCPYESSASGGSEKTNNQKEELDFPTAPCRASLARAPRR